MEYVVAIVVIITCLVFSFLLLELFIIQKNLNHIIMNQNQLAAELVAIKQQNEKARLERLEQVAKLEQAIIDAGNITPEVEAALADLKADVQTDDDLIPDAPVEEDPTEQV